MPMETDSKDEPWFLNNVPAFDPRSWQKTTFDWSSRCQKKPMAAGDSCANHFISPSPYLTSYETMFGNTQAGFVPPKCDVWVQDYQNKRFGTNVKFRPTIEASEQTNYHPSRSDITHRYQTITFMPEYGDKSIEEWRLEDYCTHQHLNSFVAKEVRSRDFSQNDSTRNEVSFFDFLLGNKPCEFSNRFGVTNEVNEDVKNGRNDSFFGNPSLLLEYLLNHARNRLNVHLISEETRNVCEKLTVKLVEYTEKTLETLMMVVLEDIVKNIKSKQHIVISSSSSKCNEYECSVASSRKCTQMKVGRKNAKKNDKRDAISGGGGGSSSCSRARSKSELSCDESEEGVSSGENRCCSSKRRLSPKKRGDRSRRSECQCNTRKKTSVGGVGDGDCRKSSVSNDGCVRRSTYADHCERDAVRRACSSKCSKGKRTTVSKSFGRRCQMTKRTFVSGKDASGRRRHDDDECCISERLQSVKVGFDDEHGTLPEDDEKIVRFKSGRSEGRRAAACINSSGGGADVISENDAEEKDLAMPATTDAASNEVSTDSDFSSV